MSSWHGTALTEAQYLEWASARYGRGNCHVMLLADGDVVFSDSSRQHPVILPDITISDSLWLLLSQAREAQQRDLILRQQKTTIPIDLANEIGDIQL